MRDLSFVWLEITGKCQLECTHCYADSGPRGSHGNMTEADWCRVLDEAGRLGTRLVQFIGGEPTLHPSCSALVDHALNRRMHVEVFSNLVHVRPAMWEVLSRPGVRLATSYYSDDPAEHAAVTWRDTHARTKANIAEAVRRSIPLRVGVVDLADTQRSEQAVAELRELGVTDIGTDRLRQVGRGIREAETGPDQLCGHCGDGAVAIACDGEVWPCVFARWMPVGNARENTLSEILAGNRMYSVERQLRDHFDAASEAACDPKCGPNCGPACNPSCWPTGAGPCGPKCGCQPNYDA
ncbi:Iron-sulfur cluster-binding domain-containing protein [Actinopolyspora xinjiangensis]|uniref:Iron-sulfur cluster-binding domain-containing protein n=1 Tax=Actinopolyspora xinjiangensis TaxID=405564 RepID=A0A1H0WAG8_9ACTN|nr:Iron-sulfur cluster-binding domain-containing protein [Actinopolyspora xinjiangensis]